MKVLQLTVHFAPNVGGVETHLSDLVYGLAKKDIQVFVLTYRPLVAQTSWKMMERSKNLFIFRMPWIPGFFYKLVHNPAVEFLYLVPGLFIATPIVLLIQKPDVIHAHGIVAGFIGTYWGKVFDKKVIVSTHSLYHFPKTGAYSSFVKWIFKNCTKVICLSNQSVKEVRSLGIESDKVGRFTYWIDLTKFKPENKEQIKGELSWNKKFVVLFVGRLVDIKGVNELLEAAYKLDKNIMIAVAGDGPLKEKIQKVSKKIPEKIEFIGKIDNNDLPKYYNGADLLIVPSTHEEGFGRVILESLACGTPVIGSNRGAIPEAMDKTVGELIDITPDNIVKQINEIVKGQTRYNTWVKNSRKYALSRYSDNNIKEIIDSYQ